MKLSEMSIGELLPRDSVEDQNGRRARRQNLIGRGKEGKNKHGNTTGSDNWRKIKRPWRNREATSEMKQSSDFISRLMKRKEGHDECNETRNAPRVRVPLRPLRLVYRVKKKKAHARQNKTRIRESNRGIRTNASKPLK